jgi:hypothetical protein
MPRLTRESNIVVGNKEIKIEDILKTIIYLPAAQLNVFFKEINLTIPRELRMFVLREVLREKVIETRKSRLTLADELNYRLSWFTEFTETQLENLLIFFDDPKLDKMYLEEFWTDLLSYMVEKQVNPRDIKKVVDQSINHVKAVGLELPNMKTFNREIKYLFFDSFGRIDGLPPQKFRPVLYKSSTLSEIRDLGSKYDVEVPRRLKKTELADIIIKELTDRNQYTPEQEVKIRGMSVLVMQRFAIDHDIKASTELKKEEIIEYILANANETRESYFIPASPEVYEKEVHEVEKVEATAPTKPIVVPVIEEVKEVIKEEPQAPAPEPVQEEPQPEVKPEPVATEKQPVQSVQYVSQTIDLSDLISEMRLLRQAVEQSNEIRLQSMQVQETGEEDVTLRKRPSDAGEPLVLNSAEFYGKPKNLKDIIKSDEANEREKFIEERKVASSIGTNVEDKEADKVPGELRFFGKLFKGIGKILWKLLKILLKIALIVAIIGIIGVTLFALLTFFVNISFLQSIEDSINSFPILGKGIIQHIHDLLMSFGLTPA